MDYNSYIAIAFSLITIILIPGVKLFLLSVTYKESKHFDPVRRVLGADYREY